MLNIGWCERTIFLDRESQKSLVKEMKMIYRSCACNGSGQALLAANISNKDLGVSSDH